MHKHDSMRGRRSRDDMLPRKDVPEKHLHLKQAKGDEEVQLRLSSGWSGPLLLHLPYLHEICVLDDFKGALLIRIRMGTRSSFGSSDHGRRKEKKRSLEEETMEKSDDGDGGGSTKLGFRKIWRFARLQW